MKHSYLMLLVFLLVGTTTFAQNNYFRYQAVVQNPNGGAIANSEISFLITILASREQKERVYSEFHTVQSDEFGMVNLNIGEGNPVFSDFAAIDWSGDTHLIRVEMDINGGTNFTRLTESPLMSVPYALHAQTASQVDDADADPENEIQQLTLEGQELSISKGNAVNLPRQTLSISGNSISISNGNTITLPISDNSIPNPNEPVPVVFRGSYIYVHPSDNAINVVYGASKATGANSDDDGKANTTTLVDAYGSGIYAAKVCDDLVAFGYDDWYLPSRAELDAIYKQNYLIQGYVIQQYWSSTETGNNKAYSEGFGDGNLTEDPKNATRRCRCIRSN